MTAPLGPENHEPGPATKRCSAVAQYSPHRRDRCSQSSDAVAELARAAASEVQTGHDCAGGAAGKGPATARRLHPLACLPKEGAFFRRRPSGARAAHSLARSRSPGSSLMAAHGYEPPVEASEGASAMRSRSGHCERSVRQRAIRQGWVGGQCARSRRRGFWSRRLGCWWRTSGMARPGGPPEGGRAGADNHGRCKIKLWLADPVRCPSLRP
jgi:hypothetical protein